ncbi:hypothetical protein B0O99DRAFT_646455 [Bisporella sp. PMI_857]|nr:hypothetical protein B0O99DRAFT_646455 [Bisporella sp. PMI_857]
MASAWCPCHDDGFVTNDSSWFGYATVPTPGGLCENTLDLDNTSDPYPCFIIKDLSLDARFASLPVVDGSLAAYRFYAGTPITTDRGINIGSFFIFDDKPRDGLPLGQRKYLHQQAANVMKHLETKRQAAERRRVVLMSQGIATFLERTSLVIDSSSGATSISTDKRSQARKTDESGPDPLGVWTTDGHETSDAEEPKGPAKPSVVDKIRITLDQAASILRESLELTSGGVVFLDTTVGYTDAGSTDAYLDETTIIGAQFLQTKNEHPQQESTIGSGTLRPPVHEIGENLSQRSISRSTDKHKVSKVQAMSAAEIATWDLDSSMLDGKTLQSLLNSYPKGNVWYIDDEGFFSSLDQINDLERFNRTGPAGRKRSVPAIDVTKQMAEATILSQIFHRARQIIFLPLWDAAGDRWYSGCFVWSQSAVPVFTVESEIAYLSAFTNSVTVEISRLDAVTANKMKSNFISSISHEFRSPLHGILASAEFLRDSELEASQLEFVSTIQNCSGTLLDTINHVLDYSKINSFENSGNPQDTISNELYRITNLALLCEDLVNGMIVAGEFRGAESTDLSIAVSKDLGASYNPTLSAVEIILDIERQDWVFKVQAGALRRIMMNIFGNAQKYTASGYILVQVGLRKTHQNSSKGSASTLSDNLLIHIRDTGKGMSSEYMERKLYRPFAQEDNFATGVGLGLSIVWSIVNQLGGKIHIRSEPGKGTDVEITIPIERPDGSEVAQTRPGEWTKISEDAQGAIQILRARASGKRVMISRAVQHNGAPRPRDVSWNCIERYCSNWFGYEVISRGEHMEQSKTVDLIITDQYDELANLDSSDLSDGQRVLVVHDHIACRQDTGQYQFHVGSICAPVGPFKLARCILAVLDHDLSPRASTPGNKSNRGTQTPLTSPKERLSIHGIPLTDYGFTPPSRISSNPNESKIKDDSVQNIPSASKSQQDGRNQALTSFHAMSLQPPSQVAAQTQTEIQPSSSFKLKSPSVPLGSTNGLHILAVDDNVLNLQLIHRYLLKRKSDSIIIARNGIEAVAAVREAAHKGKNFDIIFMDISMPEMDGFEATRLIRSFERSFTHRSVSEELDFVNTSLGEGHPTEDRREKVEQEGIIKKGRHHAYVVALTGLASRRDRDEAESSGFDNFLTKPISFGEIGDLLKRLSAKNGVEK